MSTHNMKKQLSAAYRYSYSRLALNYYTFYEAICETVDIPEPAEQYSEEFHQIVKGFLNGEEGLSRLDDLRNQVMKSMEVLTAYTDCFQIYEYVLNRMERRFEAGSVIGESVEELAEQLTQFLIKSEDAMVMNERMKNVISQLPIRYTRQKFYSMLSDGLSVYIGSDKSSLEHMLYVLRTEAMIQLPEDMKQGYEALFEILGQLKTADYRHMEQAEYYDCMEKFACATDKMTSDAGIYMLLQDMINDLYVLFLAGQEVMIDLAEKQNLEKIISGVLKAFQTGNTSNVDMAVTELLYGTEGIQEQAMERYLSYSVPETEKDDVLYEKLSKVDKLLSSSPFVRLEKTASAEEPVDRPYVEACTGELSRDLDRSFEDTSKPVMRAVMAKLIACLPMVFRSAEEFRIHIVNSLNSCTDAAERETCMELLKQVMENEDVLV